MTQAQSISLSQFTTAVQAAVKAAVGKHPKFRVDTPRGVEFSYLIRGIPVPESILANVTFGETQAFANDIAAQLAGVPGGVGEARAAAGQPQGAIYSSGRHVIVGIPPVTESFALEK